MRGVLSLAPFVCWHSSHWRQWFIVGAKAVVDFPVMEHFHVQGLFV